jgi:hypothetical protein
LLVLADLTNSQRIEREYFHEKPADGGRRRRPCKVVYVGPDEMQAAAHERWMLEQHRNHERLN